MIRLAALFLALALLMTTMVEASPVNAYRSSAQREQGIRQARIDSMRNARNPDPGHMFPNYGTRSSKSRLSLFKTATSNSNNFVYYSVTHSFDDTGTDDESLVEELNRDIDEQIVTTYVTELNNNFLDYELKNGCSENHNLVTIFLNNIDSQLSQPVYSETEVFLSAYALLMPLFFSGVEFFGHSMMELNLSSGSEVIRVSNRIKPYAILVWYVYINIFPAGTDDNESARLAEQAVTFLQDPNLPEAIANWIGEDHIRQVIIAQKPPTSETEKRFKTGVLWSLIDEYQNCFTPEKLAKFLRQHRQSSDKNTREWTESKIGKYQSRFTEIQE